MTGARPESAELVQHVLNEVGRFDPELATELQGATCVHLRDAYLLRFVLPVAELAGWPERNADILHEALAVHLLWCLYWRSLDTLLDNGARDDRLIEDFIQVAIRTVRCDTQLRCTYGLATDQSLAPAWEPCIVFRAEQSGSLQQDDVWRRAAPFLIVPESVLTLNVRRIAAFRTYLTLLGVAHDVFDILSDVKGGIRSAPLRWLAEIDPDLQLQPRHLGAYYRRAAAELTSLVAAVEANVKELNEPILEPLVGSIREILPDLERCASLLAPDSDAPRST